MKIKIKFILLLSSMLLLSACTSSTEDYKVINNPTEVTENAEKAAEISKINELTDYNRENYDENNPDPFKQLDYDDYEKVEFISITQSSSNGIVELYRNKKFKDVMLAYDTNFSNVIATVSNYPNKYKASIDTVTNNSNLLFDTFYLGGDMDMLSFVNTEYLIVENLRSTTFSVDYGDVNMLSDSKPLKVMVFIKDGVIQKIHILTLQIDTDYINDGAQDIEQVLNTYGISSEAILSEYSNNQKPSYKINTSDYTIEKIKSVPFSNGTRSINDIIITFK